ncbi:hypothetical protein BHE74_00053091 [Ensete ventricosum]|nr:hypothetical protein GW17_00062073 [Ensete ventricosum]RWW41426.1 hypothetical protein BHE74_00053091 [Ensete ventricosum]RZR97799.1 hypothetical protein BHM03_00027041 [Ensete ventricosum]
MLSEKGLTHWQLRKGECYREHDTFQTFKNFIHNVEESVIICIDEMCLQKMSGAKWDSPRPRLQNVLNARRGWEITSYDSAGLSHRSPVASPWAPSHPRA